jgi:hypothetical protein
MGWSNQSKYKGFSATRNLSCAFIPGPWINGIHLPVNMSAKLTYYMPLWRISGDGTKIETRPV